MARSHLPPAHAEPDWYRSLTPFSGGEPLKSTGGGDLVPVWNITAHIAFMNTMGITHSVLGFTGPSANVYMRDRNRTVALARLINEQLAAYARTQPEQFSFFAAVPLPYADDAIKELEYATKELGAVGVALMSNHEGMYLGHDVFTPFWKYMDGMGGRQIVYVHPTTPYIPVNDTFVVANPNPSMETSRMEYYMETARTFTDLTITQTLQNFTNTHFVLPHLGGAFPVMIDRVLKTRHPELYDSSLAIYRSRLWWDSASPTYFHQVAGLLGYDIPKANLLFGTDYPFVGTAANQADLQAILAYPGLTDDEKDNILSNNYKSLFGDKLNF
ncbi:amidohydrolase 2 [Coprinopsis cinerea okayama7|uniref:Amidohydrolase 2 n=1 Tax=Coprinopsis cinerea (strain Okayama-7 / 130 / ATCC MYA-4618 / FGSC 9003) TaxID=240176 RepID=A8N7U3_COPC7|nr:amidohydrolase 2 [Coprinopsis cinerea okayama7\|eukprot:XP_001830899.1 amidohydrolase 2 [Coprinopsis cinerea okayama7\